MDDTIIKSLEGKFNKPIDVLEKTYGENKEYPGNCPFLRYNQDIYLKEKKVLETNLAIEKAKLESKIVPET